MSNTSDGGKPMMRDVMNYSAPQGPKNNMMPGPGLRGGENLGNCGTQCGNTGNKTSVGLGGDRMGNSPTQRR